MATEQAAQWAKPSGRDTMESIAENTLQAAASAIGQVGVGKAARRLAAGARSLAAHTTSMIKQGGQAESPLAPALPWIAAAAASWLVFTSTLSWPQAAIAGTCLFALSTLSAMRSAQRLEARALREQLTELRLSLRVTQALLDVETIADAEHLDDELDDGRKSGTRRRPQRGSRPQVG